MGIETKLISTLTSAKTGTVVKKMLTDKGQLQKVIQYGEKTPLRQIGIDTVKITNRRPYKSCYEYFNNDKLLFGFTENRRGGVGVANVNDAAIPLIDPSSLSKTIKNFIDALRASKAIMG